MLKKCVFLFFVFFSNIALSCTIKENLCIKPLMVVNYTKQVSQYDYLVTLSAKLPQLQDNQKFIITAWSPKEHVAIVFTDNGWIPLLDCSKNGNYFEKCSINGNQNVLFTENFLNKDLAKLELILGYSIINIQSNTFEFYQHGYLFQCTMFGESLPFCLNLSES